MTDSNGQVPPPEPGGGLGPEPDDDEEDELDDDLEAELDELLEDWEDAELEAVLVLQEALADHLGVVPPGGELEVAARRVRAGMESRAWPHRHLQAAAGWVAVPADDVELVVGATGALISPVEETGLALDDEALLASLQFADWLGAIIGLVRAGVGADASPRRLVLHVNECPELEGDAIDDDDADLLAGAFGLVLPAWEAAGAVEDGRLTALGRWSLPRAVAWAWGYVFDEPAEE